MTVGFVMLVHANLPRAEQVARYWAGHGCPVVIHVDGKVRRRDVRAFRDRMRGVERVLFSRRVRVEWGTWSLVEATQAGARRLLDAFPDVRHVFLASGSCLPLRPADELKGYLDAHPDTDFIESVTIDEVTWTVDGLEAERFTLRFPFSWRRNRRLFDRYTALQRRLGLRRRIPEGLQPHLGSQWWCLTRRTLEAILGSPDRDEMDAYFRRVWIPDESYFQSLARRHSDRIESRSLTLSKFDVHGRPHIFYDDHLQLLERSDCFVVRKIWPGAEKLYRTFLSDERGEMRRAEPNPGKIDRLFSRANDLRGHGRAGLYSQARFPRPGRETRLTAGPYAVFSGFDDLFEGFEAWLARRVGGRVHGHLFHPNRAQFAGGESVLDGALTDHAAQRDYRPEQFLTNLIWNTRGERQSFLFGPGDAQGAVPLMLRDPNATVAVISGAWAVPLHLSGRPFEEVRAEAARLQRVEMAFLRRLREPGTAARVHLWTLADVAAQPVDRLEAVLTDLGGAGPGNPMEPPPMRPLTGFTDFLRRLRNGGMKPLTTGDFDAVPRRPALATERANGTR